MNMSILSNVFLTLPLLVVGGPVSSASLDTPDNDNELDSIVAIVNNDVIVRSELNDKLAQLQAKIESSETRLPPPRVLERQVLEHLVSRQLQIQAAEEAGISVDDETLAKAISNISRRNNMSISELRETLEADGMSFSQFREEMRTELLTSRLRNQQVHERISVTDQELENLLEKGTGGASKRSAFHFYHILIATPEAASPEVVQRAKEKAERLVESLNQGADFQQTAMMESNGRQALEGGDLGWMNSGELPSLIADRAQMMEKGEITEPIRTAGGYHIFTLAEYQGGERHLISQTHARHILINTNEIVSDVDAKNRLMQLRQRIEQGDDFEALARAHSDDKASAIKGGDLDWVSPGNLVPLFEEQMAQLDPGQISPPFRTEFGWHIVQVLERKEHDSTEETQKNEARAAIRKRKAEEATDLWLRRLRDEAYVELRLQR